MGPVFYHVLFQFRSEAQMVINPPKTLLGKLGGGLEVLGDSRAQGAVQPPTWVGAVIDSGCAACEKVIQPTLG